MRAFYEQGHQIDDGPVEALAIWNMLSERRTESVGIPEDLSITRTLTG